MPKRDTKPSVGKRQPDLSSKVEKVRPGSAKDLAESVDEKAQSGDADARAVAKAVIDLDSSDD
jgi:hypothetical protein